MKRYMMTLVMAMTAWMGANAMDYETARKEAYYLTDKMAYELNLNEQQYNDAYEINLDYLLSINTEADLLDARYLNYRNEDLRHILHAWQWTAFVASSYLFRPLLWRSGAWYLPVYDYYARTHFYYHRPSIFWEYRGGHGRYYYTHGFYASRRPVWNGGLRGNHHSMIGRPSNHRPIEHRGNHGFTPNHYNRHDMGHNRHDFGRNHGSLNGNHGRFDHNSSSLNSNHGRFDHNSSSLNSNHGSINHDRGDIGRNHGSSDRGFSGSSRGSSFSGSSRGSSFSGSSRGSSFSGSSRSSSFSGSSRSGGYSGSSRGSSFSGSSRSSSFSGGSRGGGFSGSSRGGGFGGSSRGGRH